MLTINIKSCNIVNITKSQYKKHSEYSNRCNNHIVSFQLNKKSSTFYLSKKLQLLLQLKTYNLNAKFLVKLILTMGGIIRLRIFVL